MHGTLGNRVNIFNYIVFDLKYLECGSNFRWNGYEILEVKCFQWVVGVKTRLTMDSITITQISIQLSQYISSNWSIDSLWRNKKKATTLSGDSLNR